MKTSNKNILVIGSSGLIGSEFIKTLIDKKYNIIGISFKTILKNNANFINHNIDLEKKKNWDKLLKYKDFDFIVNCMAITNLSLCNRHQIKTWNLHVCFTRFLEKNFYGKKIHLSSVAVYGSSNNHTKESSKTNPLNYYSLTKIMSEKNIICNNSLILRLNVVGFSKKNGNNLVEWAVRSINEGKNITGYNNMYFNPLSSKQISYFIFKLGICDNKLGIYNLGCSRSISKYDLLFEIFYKLNKHQYLKKGYYKDSTYNIDNSVNIDKVSIESGISFSYEQVLNDIIEQINNYDNEGKNF